MELCPGELLQINGGNALATRLNGTGIDRVFDVRMRGAGTGGVLELRDMLILGGVTEDEGGGIRLGEGVDLLILRVAVEDNFAEVAGGGIHAPNNDVHVFDSTLANNVTYGDGGGLSQDDGLLEMARSTISSNMALVRGGGIHLQGSGGNTIIDRVTITENSAAEGGGIRTSREMLLPNSILADNSASVDGPDCATTGSGYIDFFFTYWTALTPICANNLGPGAQPSPGLHPLGYHGPNLKAHCPTAGSPVVDAANDDPALGVVANTLDQYALPWFNVLPDMGACEYRF